MEFQYEDSEILEKYSMNTTAVKVEISSDIHQLAGANRTEIYLTASVLISTVI
jgi:hypothetical protein